MSLDTANKVDYKEKKQLEKDICQLTSNEHTEILNIIKNNNQKYSQNNAGVYFNLKYVDNNTIIKLIEFVKYCKDMKQKKKNDKPELRNSNNHLTDYSLNKDFNNNYMMDKQTIQMELQKLESKNKENFTFQNFLDKLSVTNIKTFKKNEKIIYPQLKQQRKKFSGVNERIVKKCRDGLRDEDFNYQNEIDSDECIMDKQSNQSDESLDNSTIAISNILDMSNENDF